jgi:glycine cleavage system aminomethyltransferase T/glycine/D-amino acid oxidase-like deaminating enzyme
MDTRARVVIVGGGIVGAAVAYHLTVIHGWRDVVLIDKGPLPYNDGSTSHAPGGVVAVGHNKLLTDMAHYSSDLYATLDPIDDEHLVYQRLGGIELARTDPRLADLVRLHGECSGWGYSTRILSPAETVEMIPFLDPSAFVGSLFADASAIVRGYHVVGDLLAKAATGGAMTWYPGTPFVGIEIVDGAVSAVVTGNPEVGTIECESVVMAANIWSPALTEQFGLRIPLMAFEHQYAITPPLPEWEHLATGALADEASYPLLRDVDTAMYYRKHWDRLGIGSYAHAPRPVRSADVGKTAMRDFTPGDFADPWKTALELVPVLRDKEPVFEKAYNGMFAFSVDGMPIIGESAHIRGLWSANAAWITHAGGVAKSVAEWMVDGDTEWDMRSCHLYRFPEHALTEAYVGAVTRKNYREIYDIVHPKQPITEPRNVRLTAFHARHVEARAVFTAFAGLELPNWYESNSALVDVADNRDRIPRRSGWGAAYWSPIQGAEHLAMRQAAGMMDLTGLSIIEVDGPGAVALVDRLCTNRVDGPVGRVAYTCWLTERGGVKRDLTVANMGADRYWMFVGEGTLPMDLAWVRGLSGADVSVRDISGAYSAVGLWGPGARDILAGVTNADLSDAAFPYFTGRWIDVGMARCYAMRISYVGELGWEIHIPVDSSLEVWDALNDAGEGRGLVLCGLGAMDSLRLEKGYRLWGVDVHTEYDPYEAGLGWTVKLGKGDFIGRDAAAAAHGRPAQKVLSCLTLTDPRATLMGYEPVLDGERVVGHVTSSNFGYSVGLQIAYAYLPPSLAVQGKGLAIEYFGERYDATVAHDPLWDPDMSRMRSA